MPLATALAGPAESAFGRTEALWGCAVTIVAVTALVLLVPDVRRLRRRTTPVAARQPADDSRALSPTSSTAPGDG
jgi:cytochrome c-type biogenesis protein CcmH/NrfF